ncbi:MAG: hypothetical protein GXP62_02195, partial [Oligoflexia bacterium]|nr:hypothetical protein [Oligoflexia bacterium]
MLAPLFIALPILIAGSSLLSCKGKGDDTGPTTETDLGPRGDCNPVDPSLCLLPFPSDFFVTQADTETGVQVSYGPTSLPLNIDDLQIDPTYWNERDGFSINSPLMLFFDELSSDGLIPNTDMGAYLDTDATTVIIDVQTGERVAHWAEKEITVDDPGQQLLILRPIHPLRYGAHYVVGVRGLVTTAGEPVTASQGFAALRDGTSSADPDIERQRTHYDDVVFPALDAAGVDRASLQQAWDLHTASRSNTTGRAHFAIEDSTDRIDSGEISYEWTLQTEGDCDAGEVIARTLEGNMYVPMYTEVDEPATLLTRDADGMPYANGTAVADFLVRIPCSVAQDPQPSFILEYGHGFFGHFDEAYTGWLSNFANDNQMVIVATDWKGMSTEDVGQLTLTVLNDPSRIASLPERSVQGMVEQNALLMLARTAFAQDDALAFDDGTGSLVNVLDPDRFGFYGVSQGSIYGVGYLGLSPFLERGVFSVGGNPYSMMFTRSNDFEPFFMLFQAKYDDQRIIMLYTIGLMQQLWDLAEGGGYLWDFNQDIPEGYPEKNALLQTAIGDAQVTYLAAHIQARGFQAHTVYPETRSVYGLTEQKAPFSGSALVEWEFSDVAYPPT